VLPLADPPGYIHVLLLLLLLLLLLPPLLLPHLQAQVQLPAEGGAALLQLAFNCSNPQTAAAAVGHLPVTAKAVALDMPDLLDPDAARRLLLTAAIRQHAEAVRTMVRLTCLSQHLEDATVLEAMLRQLLHCKGSVVSIEVMFLPAVDQLSSDAVLRLLDIAVADKAVAMSPVTRMLCDLPGAEQLDCQAVLQLLQAVLKLGHDARGPYFLPGARQLDSQQVLQLLQAAVLQQSSYMMSGLCRLPAAQQLDSQVLLQLLQTAVQHNIDMVYLIELPAAQLNDSEAVTQLMQSAMKHGSGKLDELCGLAAAHQLGADQTMQLLQTAVGHGTFGGYTEHLVKLQCAQALSSEHVVQLMKRACKTGCGESTHLLCSLPAAQHLSIQQLLQVLVAAVQRRSYGGLSDSGVKELCKLPAAKQLSRKEVVELLQAAEQDGSFHGMNCAAVLRKLPGAP
jgi:hypothetical protein